MFRMHHLMWLEVLGVLYMCTGYFSDSAYGAYGDWALPGQVDAFVPTWRQLVLPTPLVTDALHQRRKVIPSEYPARYVLCRVGGLCYKCQFLFPHWKIGKGGEFDLGTGVQGRGLDFRNGHFQCKGLLV